MLDSIDQALQLRMVVTHNRHLERTRCEKNPYDDVSRSRRLMQVSAEMRMLAQ